MNRFRNDNGAGSTDACSNPEKDGRKRPALIREVVRTVRISSRLRTGDSDRETSTIRCERG